ncbi:MAG: hypothetical protein D6743_07635 [Calditrichaeota bacterium]|nr:MAG: hypothetical protein D6743_07635 [Calditrichota bacterium]
MNQPCKKLVATSFFILALLAAPDVFGQFVVVVPTASKIDSLSLKDLKTIFKGYSVKGTGGAPYQIVEFRPIGDAFYKKLYGLDSYSIGKHWLRMIFSGERVLPPKSFSDINRFIKFLQSHDNSIGFLTVKLFESLASKSLRAVVIDGCSYKHIQYALRATRQDSISPNSQRKD